jgi:hypothetical protein
MREGMKPVARPGFDRESLKRTGSDLDKRFPVALALYAALAALVWFTMGEGTVLVVGKPVEMRWIPLIIIGGVALKTVLARQADRIRHSGDRDGDSTPRSL